MNVEVTRLPESLVALKIELTGGEVAQAFDRTYKNLVQRVTIPGFRKGKAPRPVVERAVGRELFVHEATEEAVRWGYRKAIEAENLTPVDEAVVEEGEHEHVEPDTPFQFEVRVAVKPAVQLPDYKTLRIDRQQREVTSGDVDALLEDIRERNATLEPTIRPAQVGDVVTASVSGKAGGEEVMNGDNVDFAIRDEEADAADTLLPGLSAELIGVNRGDIKEITLPLPELYPNPELAGKTLFLRILVKEIKRKVLPPLDDELAQSVSELPTLGELRDVLRNNLEQEARLEADAKLVDDAVDAVRSRTFVEIPSILIDEEVDRMIDEMRGRLERAHLSWEAYLESADSSEESMRLTLREPAMENVKTSLVVGAVADAEDIEVSNRELSTAIDELLRVTEFGESERRRLRASAGVRANVRSRLRRQRAIQRLVEAMTGEEVAPEAAEAMADITSDASQDVEETLAVEALG